MNVIRSFIPLQYSSVKRRTDAAASKKIIAVMKARSSFAFVAAGIFMFSLRKKCRWTEHEAGPKSASQPSPTVTSQTLRQKPPETPTKKKQNNDAMLLLQLKMLARHHSLFL